MDPDADWLRRMCLHPDNIRRANKIAERLEELQAFQAIVLDLFPDVHKQAAALVALGEDHRRQGGQDSRG